ncbi:ArsB/NhaD family transporter [Rappaport israeli]|uniref:sodium:proton antiporter n=1 Tax=Rappaport israeli TaxID=1839807 RepID=UPI000A9B7C82|nr:sodium:proton antiporter [Rappaport israeli]
MQHITHSSAIFGLNPMWLSGIILILVYIVLISEKINRAIIALIGAFIMIYAGLLNQHQAIEAIDFNTIFLLIGMMMMVSITAKTGVFQYVAIKSAKIVRANPIGIMLMIASITAVFSALLDNVTTVLLITPVLLLITEQLQVKAFPYLFTTIIASNIGGTATMIGDPPNIIIGSATHLNFSDFLYHMAPIAIVIMLCLCTLFWLIFSKSYKPTSKHAPASCALTNEKPSPTPHCSNNAQPFSH